jgi:hypothetical protein
VLPTKAANPTSTQSGSSSNPAAQPAVDAALRDAAARVGVPVSSLRIERVEAREWGDSSLGCPKPDQMYSQVLTPGYLVVISGGGKTLEYHTNSRDLVVLCQER